MEDAAHLMVDFMRPPVSTDSRICDNAEYVDHLVGVRPDQMRAENPPAVLFDERLVAVHGFADALQAEAHGPFYRRKLFAPSGAYQ